jgi:hypothetical protein
MIGSAVSTKKERKTIFRSVKPFFAGVFMAKFLYKRIQHQIFPERDILHDR